MNSVLAASFDTQLSPLTPFLLYVVVWGLVFVETALLIGFFLPGDSILFSAGLVAAARGDVNIVILATGVFLVAFFGDQIAFVIGRHYGRPYLEKHQTPRRARLVARSERFYERYGFWAVIIARYLPWVRTFVPVIAGVGKIGMDEVTKGVWPFMLAQFALLFLMVLFPQLVMVPARWFYG